MQLDLSPLTSAVAGGAVIIAIIILYYFFEYRPDQYIRELSKMHDFNELEFIEAMATDSFVYYNDRWTKGLFAGMAPFFIILIISIKFIGGIGVPIGLVSGGAIMIATFIGLNYMAKLQEIEAAGKGPSVPTLCHFAKHGPKQLKLRSFELKSQAELDVTQKNTLRERAVEIISGMKEIETIPFKDDKEKEAFLEKIESYFEEKLDQSYVYRYTCDGKYSIILITRNKVNDMVLPVKQSLLFKSFHINTDLMPMWSIFCGTTKKLFEDVQKGIINWTTKQAGIILDVFDWADFWTLLIGGQFIAPDNATALIGHFVHLEEQNSVTRTELNKARTDKMGAMTELESRDSEDIFKQLGKLEDKMIQLIAASTQVDSPRAKIDYFLLIIFGSMMLLLGLIAGMARAGMVR